MRARHGATSWQFHIIHLMNPIRVFVGYGYNARDVWIETYVIPLLKAFGCNVVHGEAVYGGVLADEVVRLIQSSDAMFGFTTRRDPIPGNDSQFTTHPWVVQEITTANGQNPSIPWSRSERKASCRQEA